MFYKRLQKRFLPGGSVFFVRGHTSNLNLYQDQPQKKDACKPITGLKSILVNFKQDYLTEV